MSAPGTVVWVTAAACNYLPQVRVLARSFTRHHPGRRLTVLITDRRPAGVDFATEPYDVLFPHDVGLPEHWPMTHSCKELAAAAKPYLMLHALGEMSADEVIFLDPDMIVLGTMEDVDEAARQHSLTLRPHLLGPGARSDHLRAFVEDRVLQAGTYNGGLLAASASPEARRFLEWWAARHDDGCRYDLAAAQHFDQRWLELAPSLVADIGHFDDPGLNVAFWSLPGSCVDDADGMLTIDGHPIRLLHFTGFIAERPDVLVAYFEHLLRPDDVPGLAAAYRRYADDLAREGRSIWRDAPYGFGYFDDGSPVPDVARVAYRDLAGDRDAMGDPFRTGPGSFHEWLHAPVDDSRPPITREWMEAHARWPYLGEMFPDPLGADRDAFHEWTLSDRALSARVTRYIIV